MSEPGFDSGAPAPGVSATVVPATVAVVAAAVAVPAAALALLGTVSMAVGVRRGTRRLHTTGGALAFGGVLLSAGAGAPPALALIGGAAAIIAWDAGEHAIGLGGQVGSEAYARRGILAHVGASTIAASTIVVVAAIVFVLARTGNPSAATVVLVFAVGLFALLLDR
ncbi:hypothetical protein [Salinarchaeum sp. Harcht-Bsk1]|uniref:DUF7519 family protein n=1 Tax=Salinarchaeum sp. Harcht-Bsk1 TaxID=1333523 RepID=UPI0011819214|nr:hypothetical protein [Salinarchaeum sp. Harcht-Bsk1]